MTATRTSRLAAALLLAAATALLAGCTPTADAPLATLRLRGATSATFVAPARGWAVSYSCAGTPARGDGYVAIADHAPVEGSAVTLVCRGGARTATYRAAAGRRVRIALLGDLRGLTALTLTVERL